MTCMFLLLLYFRSLANCIEFTSYENKRLDATNIKMYKVTALQMCMRECVNSMSCLSVNFDKHLLQCDLLDKTHTDSNLIYANDFVYAFPTEVQKSMSCQAYDTIVQLITGNITCIETECSTERPIVQYSDVSQSSDPPFVSFSCMTGYTGVGSVTSSTCRPGESWSSINFRCEPPVHGGWSAWGSYGSCSVTCGGGTQSRSRNCNNPSPLYGGNYCSGSSTSVASCNTDYCPINGGWSGWGSWGSCSKTCGGGTQYSYRSCDNPSPQYGGASCSGSSSRAQSCNTDGCPFWGLGKRRR